jgi:pimeloyl-ACP methyl ester carboxylesterase
MARDLLAVIDAFGFDTVRAVGHSMGGCSILKVELRRPGVIDRAWLFDPIVYPPDPSGRASSTSRLLAGRARRRQEVFSSREAALELYQSTPPFDTADPESLRAYVEFGFADRSDGSVVLKCRGEIEAQIYDLCPTDVSDQLYLVNSVITVAGSGDDVPPAMLAPLIAERLPQGDYEHHPEFSHLGPMEDPTRIAEAIAAALT